MFWGIREVNVSPPRALRYHSAVAEKERTEMANTNPACSYVFAVFCAIASSCVSAAYPEKPIRIVVPNPPGGATDVVGRLIAEKLRVALGQPAVIDNRGGAGGGIAAEAVAKAAPDGYVLMFGTGGTHVTNVIINPTAPYDAVKDFAPVSLLAKPYFGLFVHPSLPVKDAGELVALAKKQPGKLSYGSYGVGTATHLMAEHFKVIAGVNITHIPYKGSVAAQLGLVNNDVQMIFDGVGNASAHVKSGKIRMIGVASNTRTSASPDTPTLAESGVPYTYESGFFAIFAPAGTPRDVVMTLNRELVKAVKEPELRNWFAGQAYEVVGSSPEELGTVVRTQLEVFRKLVRENNIKLD